MASKFIIEKITKLHRTFIKLDNNQAFILTQRLLKILIKYYIYRIKNSIKYLKLITFSSEMPFEIQPKGSI